MPRTIELGDDVKDRDGFEAISVVTEIPKIYVPAVEQYVPVFLKIRRKPPRYVPFEKGELVEKLLGQKVKRKHGSVASIVSDVDSNTPNGCNAVNIWGEWHNAEAVLEKFTFLDGTPCGKLVE